MFARVLTLFLKFVLIKRLQLFTSGFCGVFYNTTEHLETVHEADINTR